MSIRTIFGMVAAEATFYLIKISGFLMSLKFIYGGNKCFALIQKYLGEIINPNLFPGQFIEMVNEDLKNSHKILNNCEELSTFWINLELDEFFYIIPR
jgi:hypothetical protein